MALNIEKNSLNPEFPPFYWEIYRSDISLLRHTQHRAQPRLRLRRQAPRTAVAPEPQSLGSSGPHAARYALPTSYSASLCASSFPEEGRNKKSNAIEPQALGYLCSLTTLACEG